jgi:unsaturated rhamnogalacturonyl hydrolase
VHGSFDIKIGVFLIQFHMKKKLILFIILFSIGWFTVFPQTIPQKITDSNTPLHELQPDYQVPYGPVKAEDITAVLNRLWSYIDASTPAKVIDSKTKAEINDLTKLTTDAVFEQGVFRLVSYEWGVTYGAMLLAGDATDDKKFSEYTLKRISLVADVTRYFKSLNLASTAGNNPVRPVLDPRALDDPCAQQ